MFERLSLIQEKWRNNLIYLDWFMVFVATVVSLLPIFLHCDQQRRGYPSGYFADLLKHTNQSAPVDTATVLSIVTDDIVSYGYNLNHAMIIGPFLGMCLPALLDLLIEMYVALTNPTTQMNSNNEKVVRLNVLERLVFLIGVACNAMYFVIPTDWNVMAIFTVRRVTSNLTLLLMVTPLVIFFERTTNVFSPFYTTLSIFLLSCGGAIDCYSFNIAEDTTRFQKSIDEGTYIYVAGYLLIVLAIFRSFVQFLLQKHAKTNVHGTEKQQQQQQQQQFDPFVDFNTTHVPACHMVSLIIGFFINIGNALAPAKPSPGVINLLYTLLLFATSLVFVIEMRVRQNEVFSGLIHLERKNYEVKLAEAEAAAHAFIAENEKAAKEREMQLTQELQENIANSAHDLKSPACALSLAVGSLISSFYGKTRMDTNGCEMTVVTLIGMMQSLSALNMIINRSVDAASKISGNSLIPNMGSIEIRKLMDDVLVFMRWQADGSSLVVTLEPLPSHVPINIMADFKWLREDLMCVAANTLKFSQEESTVPIIVRVTIVGNDDSIAEPMLCFSFMDSGQSLSEDRYSTLFDHPKMLSSERMGMGGMGLGLYCLRERVSAMSGHCGARKRLDGLEGTEVWFSIPLLHADVDVKTFEKQHHRSPTVPVMDKKTPSIKESSIKKPKETKLVNTLGASRKSSTSSFHDGSMSHKNGVFVFNQGKPSNRSYKIGMDNETDTPRSIKLNTPHRSNKSVFNALISRKSNKLQQPTIESVREFTTVSNVLSSHENDIYSTKNTKDDVQPFPSVKSIIASERIAVDTSAVVPCTQPSVKPISVSEKAIEASPFPSLKHDDASAANDVSRPQSSIQSTKESSSLEPNIIACTESSVKSISASERKAIEVSPFVSRRSSNGVSESLISNGIVQPDIIVPGGITHVQPSAKSITASERKSVDSSPIASSRRSSFDHLIIESYKSTDNLVASSLKPRIDTGKGALPILIVDDSIAIVKMIKRSILNEIPDLVVKEARNGNEAFKRVQDESNGFHLIITDIQMPGCDGFEFTRRVRDYERQHRLSSTMIVGMSANCQAKFVMESQSCGMDGFVHKPFELETLLDVINHVELHRDLNNDVETLNVNTPASMHDQDKSLKEIPASTTMPSDKNEPTEDSTAASPTPVPGTVNNHTIGKLAYRQPSMMISGERRQSDMNEGFIWDDELKHVRFLVVDESFFDLKMTSTALHEHGASITQARDGKEAISLCESVVANGGKDFAVILTDIGPMDTFDETKQIRAMEKEWGLEPKIIVGISAYYGDHLADKAMEAGMDAFQPKPFEYAKFMEVFNDIIQRRKNIATMIAGDKPIQQPIVVRSGSRIIPQV